MEREIGRKNYMFISNNRLDMAHEKNLDIAKKRKPKKRNRSYNNNNAKKKRH